MFSLLFRIAIYMFSELWIWNVSHHGVQPHETQGHRLVRLLRSPILSTILGHPTSRVFTIFFNVSGYDQSFYMVPTLALLTVPSDDDDSCTHANDVLKLPHPFVADDGFVPSAIAWWVRHAAGDSTRCCILNETRDQFVIKCVDLKHWVRSNHLD